eukprot:TRINITY_DN1149_c0_g1_i1.p1 TRINITY_DN1149_c0_g1~~TRINITY_DN1149_c0_g1_i1.p1  ORF type:complete len:231 (+),score=3.57 TRINITY_DN1149_c0_g1_i1:66-758(+)
MGSNQDGVLEITNCFPVPHSQSEGAEVGIDAEYFKAVSEMRQLASPSDIVVGWYSGAPKAQLDESAVMIHNFYGNEIRRPPLHVQVTTEGRVEVTGFMTRMVRLKSVEFGAQFAPIPLTITSSPLEECALRTLKEVEKLPSSEERVASQLAELEELLTEFKAYVDDVVAGKAQGNAKAGRSIFRVCERLKALRGEALDASVAEKVQDLLTVVYLGKLTRSQLKVGVQLEQ